MSNIKKAKKYVWLNLGLLPLIALPVALSTNNRASTTNANKIVFEGKVYDDVEKAANAYLQARRANVRPLTVVGDINKAIFDAKHSILNRSELFDYNANRIRPAYVTRTGSLVSRPEIAAATFATPSNSQVRYTFPGAGTYYETEADAENALQSSGFLQGVPVAKVSDPRDLRANPSELFFNATNAQDLKLIEQVLIEALSANDQAALRETEASYQKTLRATALGKDWALKSFFGEVATGQQLKLIDDVAGDHVNPALDFSTWTTQKQWLTTALPSGYLEANNKFTIDDVTYDLSGPLPRMSMLFEVNLLSPDGAPTVWQATRLKYNDVGRRGDRTYIGERGKRDYPPIQTGFTFYSPASTNTTGISYSFVWRNDQTRIHTILPPGIAATFKLSGATSASANTDPFYLTTLITGNQNANRFGLDNINIKAYGSIEVSGYTFANGAGVTNVTNAVYAGIAKTLNQFFTQNKTATSDSINLQKVFNTDLTGHAQQANLQLELAKLNPAEATNLLFKNAALDYKEYRTNEGWTDGSYYTYFDAWEAQRVRNLRAEFGLETLFNPALSGDALYQVRLDLAKHAKQLQRVITYRNQPLFTVQTNARGELSLHRLGQSFLNDNTITIAELPNITNRALSAAVAAITTPSTTPEKVRALLESKDLVQSTVDVLRQQRLQRNAAFAAASSGGQPYAQYLAELRGYLAQINLIGNAPSLQKLFTASYLPLSQYLNFPNIDYYANRVYRDNYNPSIFGAIISPELVDLSLAPADYEIALKKGAEVLGRVARVSVFYDGEGKEITPLLNTSPFDNAIFDDKEFVYDSIKRTYPLVLSRDYLFVVDEFNKEHLVASQISTIYEFIRDQTPTYFRTFENVHDYVKELIAAAATKLG